MQCTCTLQALYCKQALFIVWKDEVVKMRIEAGRR
jgi:hypothetical protein